MKDKKIKFAFFTIPEYKKEENWLRKQHNAGLRFTYITFPCIYHFKKCEPQDVIYQLDYNKEGRNNKVEYTQIFRDCNWEYITDFVGYSYFRKPVTEMTSGIEEIFSDEESKLDMTKRVFRGRMIPLLVILFLFLIPQLIMNYYIQGPYIYLYSILIAFYCIIFLWFGIKYKKLKNKVHK